MTTNVELARRGFGAALTGDLDAVRDLLAPDVKWHGGDPGGEGACQNREQALGFMRQAFSIGGLDAELVDVVGAGDHVVVTVLSRVAGAEPIANLVTFRAGKAIEMVHYPDPADALAAAGL